MAIDKAIAEQIPIVYSETHNKAETARRLGISVTTVKRYLDIFEATGSIIEEKKKRREKITITQELIDEINLRYSKEKNMAEVARQLNITVANVKKYLSEENKGLKDQINEDRDALFFYIYRLFGQYSEEDPVNPWNIVQMQKFRKEGIPYRAQLLTLKYFYEILHNSIEKSRGSIGIIPYIVTNAELYYKKEARRAEELNEAIQRQLEKDRIEIPYNPSDYIKSKGRKKKKPIDLTTIGE